MGTTVISTNRTVYPSENSIEEVALEGSRGQEDTHTEYAAGWVEGHVQNGFTISGQSGSDFDVEVDPGNAYLDGHRVELSAVKTITLDASATNHIFLQFLFVSGLVATVQISTNTSGSIPANSIKLAEVETNISGVTSTTDRRNFQPGIGENVRILNGPGTGAVEIPFVPGPTTIPNITLDIPDALLGQKNNLVLLLTTFDLSVGAGTAKLEIKDGAAVLDTISFSATSTEGYRTVMSLVTLAGGADHTLTLLLTLLTSVGPFTVADAELLALSVGKG